MMRWEVIFVVRWHAVGCLGQCFVPCGFLVGFLFVGVGWGVVVCVNCIVDACDFFFVHVLVFLVLIAFVCFCVGARWMPGHGKLMKDVVGCVKPRGVAV